MTILSPERTSDLVEIPQESSAAAKGRAASEVGLCVVIPAYNEEKGIGRTIQAVQHALAPLPCSMEIIVVDDGSEDNTCREAERAGARVISQQENKGYGAALKAGIRAGRSRYVAIIDADGTYPAERLPEMLELAESADMVVGARRLNSRNVSVSRRPAKWILTRLASYLAARKIPDLNSGLRVFRRCVLERFLALLPDGFSFTTTITLSMLCTNHSVRYLPIDYRPRIGKSKVRPIEFLNFIILVLRTIVLFNPLRIFLPVGAIVFATGMAKLIYDVMLWNLSESAVLALLVAIMVWSLGLLADMISRLNLRP